MRVRVRVRVRVTIKVRVRVLTFPDFGGNVGGGSDDV